MVREIFWPQTRTIQANALHTQTPQLLAITANILRWIQDQYPVRKGP